jgi:hypothetical protein
MSRRPAPQRPAKPLGELTLKNARVGVKSNSKVILGRVSARLAGPPSRSIQFTFVPQKSNAAHGIEAIEFELPKVEAWALAEWMTEQSMTRSPDRAKK